MNHSSDQEDEKFYNDEYVDIIDKKAGNSYEGRIIAIKGDQLFVENIEKRNEKLYDKNDKKIIKQWSPGKRIKKFNRVDFQLNGTDYWVVGVVVNIMSNNKILIRYRNNNNFKPIVEEIVDINDKRIAKVGLYTKFDGDKNKLLSSTILNLGNSTFNNLENNINSNHKNVLNNKRKRSNENNKTLTKEDEEEEDFQILLLQSNLRIKEVKGDGNCLFRAVSDQVYGTDQYYELLREKCMDYLVIMRRFFEPYIGEDFDDYIKEKRKNQTWGDDIELEALSEIYSRPVEIYKGSNKPLKTFHENKYYSKYDTKNDINFTLYPIRLSYHKRNHYNSIIPLETDVTNYKKYRDSLIKSKPGYFESKMIQNAEDNEAELDKGIQVSNDFFLRLKKNLSEKIEDIANKNNLSEEEEEQEENIKNKKIKREEDKEKNKEEIYKINKIDKEKETKNKNNENNNNDNDNILSNSTIKSALELGYDYEDAIEAWGMYGDNKELVINYLLNKNNNMN